MNSFAQETDKYWLYVVMTMRKHKEEHDTAPASKEVTV